MPELKMMSLFKVMLLVQLFYAVSISLIAYSLPADSLHHIDSFSDLSQQIDIEEISSDVEESVQRQTSIPVIELGALVFYSGNILIDLILNFLFAIPQMLGLLFNGFTLLGIPIDGSMLAIVETFASAAVTIMYILGVIQLLTDVRSGRVI